MRLWRSGEIPEGESSTPPFVASMLEEATGCSEMAPTVAPPAERSWADADARPLPGFGAGRRGRRAGRLRRPGAGCRDRTGVGARSQLAGDPAACGCSACASCLAHASNKLFASAASADSGRAHPYCKCLVVPLVRLDVDVYDSLFLDGGGRESVDRRHQWVQAVFTHEPSAEQPSFSPPVESAARTLAPARAVVGRVRIRRGINGQRVLYADIDCEQTLTATLVITRQGAIVARRVIPGVNGTPASQAPDPGDDQGRPGQAAAPAAQRRRNDHDGHPRDSDPALVKQLVDRVEERLAARRRPRGCGRAGSGATRSRGCA